MDDRDENRHSTTRYYRRCYNIDADHLRRVITVMKDRTRGSVDISMTLGETESISNRSLEALLSSSVLDAYAIDEIRLTARDISSNSIESMSIVYRKAFSVGPILVRISGKTDAVEAARLDVERIIASSSRWYWPLNYRGNVIAYVLYLLIFGVTAMLGAALNIALALTDGFRHEYPNAVGFMFGGLIVTYTSMLWSLRDLFFPAIEFRIGKSGMLADWRDWMRKVVFATVAGGILLALIGNKVWDLLQSKPASK